MQENNYSEADVNDLDPITKEIFVIEKIIQQVIHGELRFGVVLKKQLHDKIVSIILHAEDGQCEALAMTIESLMSSLTKKTKNTTDNNVKLLHTLEFFLRNIAKGRTLKKKKEENDNDVQSELSPEVMELI